MTIRLAEAGAGEPVLLCHGFADGLETWWDSGWSEALRDHRLLAYDARGHGASSKPHERSAYSLAARLADAVAVLDAARVPAAHVLGYSMGGWTALNLALHHPERVRSLVVGGATAFPQSLAPLRGLLASGLEAMADAFTRERASNAEAWRARVLANDVAALTAVAADDRPGIPDGRLPHFTLPSLLWVGDADPLRPEVERLGRTLPRASTLVVAGASHFAAYAAPDAQREARALLGRVSPVCPEPSPEPDC